MGYPTPSPALAVNFVSRPDPTNHEAVYRGTIVGGPYIGSGRPNYLLLITNTGITPIVVKANEFAILQRGSGNAIARIDYFQQLSDTSSRSTVTIPVSNTVTQLVFGPEPYVDLTTVDVVWSIGGGLGQVTVPIIPSSPVPTPTPLPCTKLFGTPVRSASL